MSSRPVVPSQIRKVFEGRIFTVNVESITLPKGERLEAEIVRHPGSAVLIPVMASGTVVLVRQYRPAIGRFAWELPAGSLKPGEDPEAAASRECQEEIGLIPATIRHLGGFFPTPGYCDEEMHFYLATGLREPTKDDPAARQDEDEDIESKAFSVEEIRRMIAAGTIIDLKTIAGLALLPLAEPAR
ncbi:MAG: NUDIX hydrolase [Acidobacteria bacterium]|nr:NUDIX hydrolase [Acidobacteriota bacterium]